MSWNVAPWRSLRTRVTAATLAVFAVGIWSLTFYASRTLRDAVQSQLADRQRSSVRFVAAAVDDELGSRMRALTAEANAVSPERLQDTTAMQGRLARRPVLRDYFNDGVLAYRLDGTVVAGLTSTTARGIVELAGREAMAAVRSAGGPTIGRPVVDSTLETAVFVMAAPVRDAGGAVIGALAGVTNLGKPGFLDFLKGNHYGRTGEYFLIAKQDRLIIATSHTGRSIERLPPAGVVPAMDRFVDGHVDVATYVNHFGVEVVAASRSVPAAGWEVSTSIATEEAFAPIRELQRRILLVAIVLTLLVGALSWWMLGRQLAPVLSTARTLAALSDADQPPLQLPITRHDEIGGLIGGFNHLLNALARRDADRKQAEISLRELLREKEALLKEVHHRVKNNLQVVSSLLRLEAGRSAQPDTKVVLAEMQGRIQSMSMLHETLYVSGKFASVDLGDYLRRIVNQAFRAQVAAAGDIDLRLELSTVHVAADQAMPCGLLVNELISNCLKHGFPDRRTGKVLVELQPVNGGPEWRLRVSDTGVGLPPDFAARRDRSLGLQLTSDLAQQLGGSLVVGPGPAADFSVTFGVTSAQTGSHC